jgi:NDP-sugar pyrophosphorylase family protein
MNFSSLRLHSAWPRRVIFGKRWRAVLHSAVFRGASILMIFLQEASRFSMQSLILAGGKGTRLRPLTIHTPKPVVPIVNRPFLLYQLDLLKRAGIRDITLSLSYQPGKIEEILADGQDYGVHIRYAVEASPLGTAGAYRNAAEHLSETTVVFNGDVLTTLDLSEVIASHRARGAAATIVLAPVENPSAYGLVETEADGRVRRFLEKPRPEEITCNTINAGVYILEPRLLDYIPVGETFSFEYQLFPALLAAAEPFYAYTWEGYWLDIGTPARYLQAHADLLARRLEIFPIERSPLPRFAGEGEPPRVDEVSVIETSCTLKGGAEIINSVLGPNCLIEERARIENSVLWAGARVGPLAVVRGSIVGRSGIIGRNALVEGAVLGDKSSLTDYTQV